MAAVEMEASALFAIAQYRQVEIASILTISDSLAGEQWDPKFQVDGVKESLHLIYEVALETLLAQ